MKTQKGFSPLIVVLVIVIILGGVIYLVVGGRDTDESTNLKENDQINTASTTEISNTDNRTIRDISKLGGNSKCTVRSEIDKNTYSEGIVYISNSLVRGDFKTVTKGNPIESHMIEDGKYVYVWSGNQGTKIAVNDKTQKNPNTTTNSGIDMDTKANYECGSWTKDESVFKIPKDVKFLDMQEMMKSMINVEIPNIPNIDPSSL